MTRLAALFGIGLIAFPAPAQSPTAKEKQATIALVRSLQRPDGGFGADAKPETPTTLSATLSALRILKYFGAPKGPNEFLPAGPGATAGEPQERAACRKFLTRCYDPASGGFAPRPGGKPDVRSTALGVMAYADLYMRRPEWRDGEVAYLNDHAKSFEDIRLTAAALDVFFKAFPRLKSHKPQKAGEWIAAIHKLRNPNGTYSKGGNVARETGGAVAAVLRLGGTVKNRPNVVKALLAGQKDDGAWGKAGAKSDLETTYRVMRALVMLKEKPDVAACRQFVSQCRNADGNYGIQPGKPGNISAIYFAGIIQNWLDAMK